MSKWLSAIAVSLLAGIGTWLAIAGKPTTAEDAPVATLESEPAAPSLESPENTPGDTDADLDEQAIADILRIRRNLSGGAGEGPDDEAEFVKALKRVAKSKIRRRPDPTALNDRESNEPAPSPSDSRPSESLISSDNVSERVETRGSAVAREPESAETVRMLAAEQEEADTELLGEPHHAALVAALHEACRQLDRVAHDHETERNYRQADRLRRLSDQIRGEARELDAR